MLCKSCGNENADILPFSDADVETLPSCKHCGSILVPFSQSKKSAVHSAVSQDLRLPAARANNRWYLISHSQSVIVFVHGILSDSRDCWLYKDPSDEARNEYWPRLIASDPRFRDTSLFLGGYYTAVDAGPYEIRNCATELFGAMNRVDETGSRPVMTRDDIVFVCHSTGGVVARYLLDYYSEKFRDKRVAILLIASPSYGSKWADKLSLLSRFYNLKLGIQLNWGSWSLRELDARFKDLVNERKIPSLIGIEAYENRFIFHNKFVPIDTVVVTEESAGRYFGAPVLLRETDHFSSVKPSNTKHPAHELLVDLWSKLQQLPQRKSVSTINDQESHRTNGTLEVTKVRFTDDGEFDVLVRNIGDVELIIHTISITKLEHPGIVVAPLLAPTAKYHVPVDDIKLGHTKSLSVSHAVPARTADRLLIALDTTYVYLLKVTLHYNQDQKASFTMRTWES
jgi:hypothetical protein